MFTLALPGTDPVIKQSVETRPKALAAWLDQLPFASPMHAAQQLLMGLYGLNRLALDEDDRATLLALYRPVVARAAASLEALVADAGFPPQPQQRQTGTLLRELQIELGIGAKHVLQALANRRIRANPKRLAEAAARVLRAAYDIQFACHLTRVATPAGLWRETHQVYAFAHAAGVALLAADDAPTPATAYCQTLLIARADPPHMNHAELVHVRLYLDHYATRAALTVAPVSGHQGFTVRLDGDTAPSPATPAPSQHSLWLDTDALCHHLQDLSLRLRTGDTPRRIGLPPDMDGEVTQSLCTLLLKQWCEGAQRAFRRHVPVDNTVQGVIGLRAIHRLLNPAPAPGMEPPDPDTGSGLAALTPSRWAVMNDSAAGLALTGTPETPLNLKVGEPLALQDAGVSDWSLAIVRWLRMRDAQQVELGIERLSPRVEAVWVRPLRGHRTTVPEAALFVPGIAAMKQDDHLMLPRHLYQLGIEAEVTHGARTYTIVFGKRIDPTPSFDLIDFTVLDV